MFKWIKRKLALMKFNKKCPDIRCSCCAYEEEDDDHCYCGLKKQLNLLTRKIDK